MLSLNLQSLAADRKVVLKEYAAVYTPVMAAMHSQMCCSGVGGPALPHWLQAALVASVQKSYFSTVWGGVFLK